MFDFLKKKEVVEKMGASQAVRAVRDSNDCMHRSGYILWKVVEKQDGHEANLFCPECGIKKIVKIK